MLKAVYVVLFVIISGCASRTVSNNEKVQLTFFDVGNGTCTLISCGNNKAVLYDCGYSNSKLSRAQHIGYISSEIKNQELLIILSHGDTDHYNLVSDLISKHKHKHEFVGYGGDRTAYGILANQMPSEPDLNIATKRLNDSCPVINFRLIEGPHSSNKNESSLMLFGKYNRFKFLFTGDATGKTEKNALAKLGIDLKNINLLTASHHGASSESSNHSKWVQYLNPQYVIFSSGNHRGYRHPRCEVKEKYEEVAIKSNPHPLSCWGSRERILEKFYSKAIYNTYDLGTLFFDLESKQIKSAIYKSQIVELTSIEKSSGMKVKLPLNETKKYQCIKKTCSEIETCEEATYLFKVCGFKRLDGNRGIKGVPCEKLCN